MLFIYASWGQHSHGAVVTGQSHAREALVRDAAQLSKDKVTGMVLSLFEFFFFLYMHPS
ncbi:unnamed protein product, partial [Urochloa humidicola]